MQHDDRTERNSDRQGRSVLQRPCNKGSFLTDVWYADKETMTTMSFECV